MDHLVTVAQNMDHRSGFYDGPLASQQVELIRKQTLTLSWPFPIKSLKPKTKAKALWYNNRYSLIPMQTGPKTGSPCHLIAVIVGYYLRHISTVKVDEYQRQKFRGIAHG